MAQGGGRERATAAAKRAHGSVFRAGSDSVSVYADDARRTAQQAEETETTAAPAAETATAAYDGPPLVYDKAAMQQYWQKRSGELARRWAQFLRLATPLVAKLVRKLSARSMDEAGIAELAADARRAFEKLGPTYVKLAQMLSVRPDVLPLAAMDELAKLQDSVAPFDTCTARALVESTLGRRIEEVFSDFSAEPVAAASLAQVYRARLLRNGEEVAVKVQRPDALATVSKDLYVLQRAVQVYDSIIKRWTAQETDYVQLLDTWANGFYTELDFYNEARNQARFRTQVLESMGGRVYVPLVRTELCSRQLLVTEWVNGTKLTQTPAADIARLMPVGQECFLRQLLEEPGLFHLDAHPGNLLKLHAAPPPHAAGLPHQPELCLIDFGLTMTIPRRDREVIVNGIVHLANKDWRAVTEDMVELGFLPRSIDRSRIMPLVERVLTPYVFQGGGVAGYMGEGEGGGVFSPSFQNLARDLASAAVDIPFSVPPYFALLARAIALLEGIALQADPHYKIVLQSYPYVARRLLRDGDDSHSFRQALNAILYPMDNGDADDDATATMGGSSGFSPRQLSPQRLRVLLNYALGRVATGSAAGVIDLDALPEESDAATYAELLDLLLSDDARALRGMLIEQLATVSDLLLRREVRRIATRLARPPPTPVGLLRALSPVPLPRLPSPPLLPPPVPFAALPQRWRDAMLSRIAPPLSESENIYASDALTLARQLLELDKSVDETHVLRLIDAIWRKRDDELTQVLAELAAQTLGIRVRAWRRSGAVDARRAAALREIGVGVRERLREIQRARLTRRPHAGA